MNFRHIVSATALLAFSLFPAGADERCLDRDCTMTALFDSGEEAATTGKTAAPASATAAKRYGTWGIDLDGMDRSVKPGDDFFKFVNGKWAATTTIPADKTSFGAFVMLRDLSEARVRAILDRWAANGKLKPGSDEAKVAAVYRTYLDEAAAEKLDRKPIQPHLDAARKAETHEDVARLMARAPATFGRSFFNAGVSDDQKNPEKYTLYMSQGGIGLQDREFYLRDNFKPQKERYQQYVADILRLAGWAEPEKHAAAVVELETKIADAHWTRSESRNRDKTYNPMTVAELGKDAPGFPWALYFKEAGLDKTDRAVVRQNTALPKLAQIFAGTPVETLKAWQAFHVTDEAAPLLSKRFVDTHWEFRSKFLNGTQEQRPRWKRAVDASENAMGEAIGRTYVAEYFPADSKAKMEKLVADLRAAMKVRIQGLEWMGPETKTRAIEKLAKFGVKIGYPAKWRDYSKLEIKEGDLAGNAERADKFDWAYDVSRIGQKVDEGEWGMTPQTVNAYYASAKNEIVFPAAILQPPFFDPQADPAVNYGAIGGVIGHEITHGFDDQGRKSDGDGMLRDWWAAEDAAKFEAQATKLGAQYEGFDFPQLPGMHIVPRMTMGENIGDLGGILLGLEAYRISLNGKPAPVLDGFTGDQRVFLGWGQVWRSMMRDDALRQYITTDSHSPGMIRAFAPLRNVDAWYEAFGVKEGDKNYVKPEERVRIW
ncbi:MAG TPA: M13-type metalloendopeptidase [Thermoanaerobaculia bacterium]|nr:M13-type metalloendopeptidase [Thermoanaerobaculia bacterium]